MATRIMVSAIRYIFFLKKRIGLFFFFLVLPSLTAPKKKKTNIQIIIDQGDWLEVTVTNALKSTGLSMHFHGVTHTEADAVYEDGADGITQSSIPAGGVHVYRVRPLFAGTYWYHAHTSALYVDGVYGTLIVRGKQDPEAAGGDIVVFFSEISDQLSQTFSNSVSLSLVNGVSRPVFELARDTTYRVHVIHGGFRKTFNLQLPVEFNAQLYQADGQYVAPRTVTEILNMDIGQRYSFLIRTPSTNSATIVNFGDTSSGTHAEVTFVVGDDNNAQPLTLSAANSIANEYVLRADTAKRQFQRVPQRAHYQIVLDYFFNAMVKNTPYVQEPGVPFIAGNKKGVHFKIPKGTIVDLVMFGSAGAHPFHLHQFAPWLIGEGARYRRCHRRRIQLRAGVGDVQLGRPVAPRHLAHRRGPLRGCALRGRHRWPVALSLPHLEPPRGRHGRRARRRQDARRTRVQLSVGR
jgi:FtsP/CotA-like multicopper oxidase with cupredoxin domain